MSEFKCKNYHGHIKTRPRATFTRKPAEIFNPPRTTPRNFTLTSEIFQNKNPLKRNRTKERGRKSPSPSHFQLSRVARFSRFENSRAPHTRFSFSLISSLKSCLWSAYFSRISLIWFSSSRPSIWNIPSSSGSWKLEYWKKILI